VGEEVIWGRNRRNCEWVKGEEKRWAGGEKKHQEER